MEHVMGPPGVTQNKLICLGNFVIFRIAVSLSYSLRFCFIDKLCTFFKWELTISMWELFIKMLQFFGPRVYKQMKCKLDVVIPSLKLSIPLRK